MEFNIAAVTAGGTFNPIAGATTHQGSLLRNDDWRRQDDRSAISRCAACTAGIHANTRAQRAVDDDAAPRDKADRSTIRYWRSGLGIIADERAVNTDVAT